MTKIIWQGNHYDSMCRVVSIGDKNVAIERLYEDSLGNESWQPLKRDSDACSVLAHAICDMRHIFDEEVDRVVKQIRDSQRENLLPPELERIDEDEYTEAEDVV
jgi:hypothetical protein